VNDQDWETIRLLSRAFISIRGALTVGFSILSFAALYLLPGELRTTTLAFALFLTALGLVAAVLSRDSVSVERKKRLGFTVLGFAAVAGSAFVFASQTWIFEVEGMSHVAGTSLSAEAVRAIDALLVANHKTALLNLFGHDSADRIWIGRNVTKAALAGSFAFSCALAATGCCLLTLEAAQRK
jgi:hypothetical protein